MPQIAPLRLTGARVLLDGALHDAALTVACGLISDIPAPEVDLRGYLLLPGIIDLHGDGFERHLTPRPTAPFDKKRALGSAAAELAANGVTTAWFAQSWSWEGGFRSGEATVQLLAALQAARADAAGDLLADVRVQIRLETHVLDDHSAVLDAVRSYGVDYVVFNDHLPEALDMAETKPDRFAAWAAQTRRTPAQMLAIVRAAQAFGPKVPAALTRLAGEFAALGVAMGSHDDTTAQTRASYRAMGAHVCEFPTTVEAAMAAKTAGEPVLMGAPNVVRGGSQSGNIAAIDLVRAGLCDALVSDYYYPALGQAAFYLAGYSAGHSARKSAGHSAQSDENLDLDMDLARAWDLISAAPARIAGLHDRGSLAMGKRADLVAINPATQTVELTISAGRVAHLSGTAARRMLAAAPNMAAR